MSQNSTQQEATERYAIGDRYRVTEEYLAESTRANRLDRVSNHILDVGDELVVLGNRPGCRVTLQRAVSGKRPVVIVEWWETCHCLEAVQP